MSAPQRPMTALEWGLLLLLSLVWGGSFFFVGVAVRELSPLLIVSMRVSIAAALLWMFAPILGASPRRIWREAPSFLLLGLINNVAPFLLIVWAQTRLASGVAAILNAATPVIAIVAAHWLTHAEKLSAPKALGALVGVIGVAVMIGPDALARSGDAWSELAVIAAAACYALASIYARRFRGLGLAPIDVATGQLTASTLLLAPVTLSLAPWQNLGGVSWTAIAAVLALASASTAFAYVLYFRILAGAGAVNVVLVTLLAPATSVLLGSLLLGERLAAGSFIGLGCIALGLGMIDGRLWRALRRN